MRLSKKEKKELIYLARAGKFRNDMRKLRRNRVNPFFVDGKVDVDLVIRFLNDYNEFINHRRKKPRRFIEKNMKL